MLNSGAFHQQIAKVYDSWEFYRRFFTQSTEIHLPSKLYIKMVQTTWGHNVSAFHDQRKIFTEILLKFNKGSTFRERKISLFIRSYFVKNKILNDTAHISKYLMQILI